MDLAKESDRETGRSELECAASATHDLTRSASETRSSRRPQRVALVTSRAYWGQQSWSVPRSFRVPKVGGVARQSWGGEHSPAHASRRAQAWVSAAGRHATGAERNPPRLLRLHRLPWQWL